MKKRKEKDQNKKLHVLSAFQDIELLLSFYVVKVNIFALEVKDLCYIFKSEIILNTVLMKLPLFIFRF